MTLPVDKVSKSDIGVLSAKENKSNMCLSALSHSAMSHLKPHLAEVTLNQGAILWDSKRPTTDIYFPTSGLISIVLSMPDGECVEVASVAREGAVGAYFDPVQSDLLTRGVVQTGGELTRISLSNLLSAASQKHEIKDLVAFCRDWILAQGQLLAACNAIHAADKRFCRWLYQYAQRMESETVYVTQESIAAVLGLRRTTVTLIAQALQKNGSIHYSRGKISILDMRMLQLAACGCCNNLERGHWPSTRLLAAASDWPSPGAPARS